jgi:predicted nucleotidyltransferase component of viral defense system
MTHRGLKNVAASARARLRNRCRNTGEDSQFLLLRYAAERFLYRLGQSPHRAHYVLKGAMLFPLWGGSLYRATRDLDFMGYGSSDLQIVLDAMREICQLAVEDDGLLFDASGLTAEPIREEAEYNGLRLRFLANLGNTRIPMQIDVGFGNAIEPSAKDVKYPTILDAPAPNIRAYPREAVVAEKLHAMVLLGERNSRLKDFYDLHALARQFRFDGERLARAIAATFERRRTAIDAALPVALTPRFFADGARVEQWRGYLSRNALPGASPDFTAIGELHLRFLGPVWDALATSRAFAAIWPPAGPWTNQTATKDSEP